VTRTALILAALAAPFALGCTLSASGLDDAPDAEPPGDGAEADGLVDGPPDVDARDDGHGDGRDDAVPDGDALPDAEPDADAPEDALPDEAAPEDAPVDDAPPPCPADCSGHGTCSWGACICNAGYAGDACETCAPSYTGYPACVHCGDPLEPCCGGSCVPGLECVLGSCVAACPADMVRLGTTAVCIDRYEASRTGTAASGSVVGVAPWANVTRWNAETACLAAGKRLCTAAEWQSACQGPSGFTYPYGATLVAGACNDTNGGSCPRDVSRVLPTGSLGTCQGGYAGIFDMSGNVWEWVWDTSGSSCGLRGGSVDSCRDAVSLSCTNLAWQRCDLEWPGLGFRCCRTL